jgi:hypothetical protein
MKFNKQTNEKQRLLDIIKKSHMNKTFELEAIVYHKGSGSEKMIKYDDFVACLKRIKNQKEFKVHPAVEVINITFRQDSPFKNLRVSVSGKETVKFFCSHGRLKDLGSNVKYYHKELRVEESGKVNRVDIEDYNIRFNLKEERPIDETNELIRDLLEKWHEVPKFFRYKKIFTFETTDGLFRNDLAIVKESKKEIKEMTVADVRKYNLEDLLVKPDNERNLRDWWNGIRNQSRTMVKVANQAIYYQSFQKSGTLENKPYYEIEVEYLGNQKGQKTLNEYDIMNKFIELVGIHIQAIQRSYFIIGQSEINSIRNDLFKLAGIKGKNMFKGSQLITLEMSHIQQLTNRQYLDESNQTIRKNFLVTEKADGERQLLFINPKGEFYFINRQNTVRKLGIVIPQLANTFLDGEFLEDKNLFMLFDVYFFEGKPLWKEIFEPRYDALKKITAFIKSSIEKPSGNVEIKNQMSVGYKTFYRGDIILNKTELDNSSYDTLIFEACRKILNQVNVKQGGLLDLGHQFSYNVDGLVFIPANLHVGQDYPGHKVNTFSESASWLRTYKWKPPINNSIDMEIQVFHPNGKTDTSEQYLNGRLYRKVIVNVNYQSHFHFQYNAQRVLNEGLGYFNGSKPFNPNYPFIGELDYNNNLVEAGSVAWIPVDTSGNMITSEGVIVQDGDVVEFTYDLEEFNPEFRWKALRHRPGKGANGYHTAVNVWRSIHNPITTKMIIGQSKIPAADVYYQSNIERSELYLAEMNKFHNFVKSRLFEHIVKDIKRPNILDLACGKFGDYYKWININPNFILGVEYAQDNINNYENGAAVRALRAEENNDKLKKLNSNVMVVWGDCGKSINTAEAAMDDLNKYYLKVLYGEVDIGDYSKLGKLSGKALQKFDVATCHFAIHYFFGNYDNLNGFLGNVYQNLKTGGYFIGTCLDGKTLFNKFKTSKSDVLEQYQTPSSTDEKPDTKLIWRIRKQYPDMDQMMDDETSLGMKIDADVESINNTSHEFLVNFDYLTKLMVEYGFELVDSRLFHEVPNSMLEEFYAEKKPIGTQLRNKIKALEYSVLHRWFIFVKRSVLDEITDDQSEVEEAPIEDEEEQSVEEAPIKIEKKPIEEKNPIQEKKTNKIIKKQKGGNENSGIDDLPIEELDLEKIIIKSI